MFEGEFTWVGTPTKQSEGDGAGARWSCKYGLGINSEDDVIHLDTAMGDSASNAHRMALEGLESYLKNELLDVREAIRRLGNDISQHEA